MGQVRALAMSSYTPAAAPVGQPAAVGAEPGHPAGLRRALAELWTQMRQRLQYRGQEPLEQPLVQMSRSGRSWQSARTSPW